MDAVILYLLNYYSNYGVKQLFMMPTYILVDTIKPRLFWLTLTTYVYKTIQTLGRKMAESSDLAKNPSPLKSPAKCGVFNAASGIEERRLCNNPVGK